jgi:hypothetical protein
MQICNIVKYEDSRGYSLRENTDSENTGQTITTFRDILAKSSNIRNIAVVAMATATSSLETARSSRNEGDGGESTDNSGFKELHVWC